VQPYFKKISYIDTRGYFTIAKTKSQQLYDLKLSDNPLILVAEAPEKPGNIGALFLDNVIIANPKVIYTTPILCVLV
jgi:TrmH family RNA methyltransferase